MAEATILFAVKNMADLLIHADLLQGAEVQVKLLKDDLENMQRFMKDASEKQGNDERIRKWISDVRDVAQDADHIIDALFLRAEATKRSIESRGKLAFIPKHPYNLIAKQIENIRAKLRDIEILRDRYGIQDLRHEGIESCWRRRQQLSPRQKNKQLVGIEEDVEILLKKVISEKSKGLSTTSIVGKVGIGKSTLARRIYDHAVAAERFYRCVWVVVSGECTPKDVIKELMLQLLDPREDKVRVAESLEELPLMSIQELVRRRLHDARLFVVLDDVGQDAQWESIASIFTIEDKGSRLLLTSRNEDIAKDVGYVHKMKTLDLNKSWKLLTRKAFIDNHVDRKIPQDMEIIGREILKKCDGLPLAISLVGGLLWEKNPSKRKWEKVLNDINTHLGTSSSTVLSTILELSYRDLPPQMKSCFLCLGFFNDHVPVVRAEKLVNVWIAQGLVVPLDGRDQEETKEELGRRYLDELINRNMLDVMDLNKDGRIKSCCIHRHIRELSITKAEKEISFEIKRKDGKQSFDKPRHLAIYAGGDRRFVYNSNRQHEHINAHSLFFHGVGNSINNNNPSYLKSFELLKILDFEDLPLKNVPETIGILTRLKYLGLRNTKIKSLPHSIGRLKNLEVLDIAKVYKVIVGDAICEMESLRHVYSGFFYSMDLLKTGNLKNLQTLGYVYAGNLIPGQVTKMIRLRKLILFIKSDLDFEGNKFFPLLAMLKNLVCLELKWGPPDHVQPSELRGLDTLQRITRLKLKGAIITLPDASEFPPNLSHLTLLRTYSYNDPLSVLEKLPKLVYLKLDCAYSGSKDMVIAKNGFPMLQVLVLRNMRNLKNVRVGKGAVPKIKQVHIYRCGENLGTNLPNELRSVTTILPL